jgi:CheY-like chemotaxis protein
MQEDSRPKVVVDDGINPTRANSMPRPTLLVAEPEPRQALSVRKLVLETGKFNVLTAHSTREAIDLFRLFPNISASVLVGADSIDCDVIAKDIKRSNDKIPVIFLQARIGAICHASDHRLASDEPEKLLDLIRSLLGDPREDDAREQHERTA